VAVELVSNGEGQGDPQEESQGKERVEEGEIHSERQHSRQEDALGEEGLGDSSRGSVQLFH
jgi:hypothetical protein